MEKAEVEITNQNDVNDALMFIGGIRAIDRLADNLSAQTITALIQVEEKNLYKHLGFNRFVDFLDDYGLNKNRFYERKKLLEDEGIETYDLFNASRIPLSTRKLLLESGDVPIYVDGDNLIIGESETPISDNTQIKQLVQDLAGEIRISKDALKTKEKRIENLKSQVETGQSEYDELRRAFDSASDGTEYQKALVKAIGGLLNLAVVANQTPIVEKALRGRDDLQALMSQMANVRIALVQDDFIFTESDMREISPLARQAIEETGDWDDEDEQ